MRIEAIIDTVQKRVLIPLPVKFIGFNGESGNAVITFLVDTGASATSLGFLDVEKLTGIPASKLPPYKKSVVGVGGSVDTRVLEGTIFIFRPDGEILEKYSQIITSVPKLRSKGKKVALKDPQVIQQLAMVFPSLLGMDIIKKGVLHISFRDNEAYLEIP